MKLRIMGIFLTFALLNQRSSFILMEKANVLFVAQEITPYLKETPIGKVGRYLPQGIQERGKEIRTFMPRFGNINERRNQLHEVIRLSGMNLIINDTDHPLIIKVASIQAARMQIYFIDNEEYFQRKSVIRDKSGKFFKDNDERAVFFSRGVLETVKKLGWPPNIVHCHGWMSSLVPLYIKTAFKDNPLFADTKVIYSVYEDGFEEKLAEGFKDKIRMEGIEDNHLKYYDKADYVSLTKAAVEFSDAVIIAQENINADIAAHLKDCGKPVLGYQDEETYIDAYNSFYDELLGVKEG